MNWSDVAEKIKKTAPEVAVELLQGDAIGGVRAAVAGFLGADSPTPDAVSKALDANPELAARLKELDLEQYRAETERQSLFYQDLNSARELHATAIENGEGGFQNRLAAGVLVGGILMLAGLIFIPEQSLSDNLRMFVLGFLTSEMGKVLSHYFGSTRWGNRNAAGNPFTPPASPGGSTKGGGFMSQVNTKRKGS